MNLHQHASDIKTKHYIQAIKAKSVIILHLIINARLSIQLLMTLFLFQLSIPKQIMAGANDTSLKNSDAALQCDSP